MSSQLADDLNISTEWKEYVDNYWNEVTVIQANTFIKHANIDILLYFMRKNGGKLLSMDYDITVGEPNYLEIFSTHINKLIRIALTGDNVRIPDLRIIASSCSNLSMLYLRVTVTVTCTEIKRIYNHNPNLKLVGLQNHHCYEDGSSYNGECLEVLPNGLKELRIISCKVGPKVLMESLLRHRHIERLRLDDCYNIPSDIYKRIITLLPNIHEFSYNYAHKVPSYKNLHCQFQPSFLQSIILFYNPLVNDDLIKYLTQMCRNLKYFSAGNAPGCSDLYTNSLWPSSERSEYLNLSGFGVMRTADFIKLHTLTLFGLNIRHSDVYLRCLADIPTLRKVALATLNVDFSELAAELMVHCNSLVVLIVLGHVFDQRKLKATIRNMPQNRQLMKLYLERGSFPPEDWLEYYSPSIQYEFESYDNYCVNYSNFFSWLYYGQSL